MQRAWPPPRVFLTNARGSPRAWFLFRRRRLALGDHYHSAAHAPSGEDKRDAARDACAQSNPARRQPCVPCKPARAASRAKSDARRGRSIFLSRPDDDNAGQKVCIASRGGLRGVAEMSFATRRAAVFAVSPPVCFGRLAPLAPWKGNVFGCLFPRAGPLPLWAGMARARLALGPRYNVRRRSH